MARYVQLLITLPLAHAAEKFITLGDWGGAALGSYHSVTVGKVASEMASCAADNEVSFVVNTGDNFYYCGIQNSTDPQIQTDWLAPYNFKSLKVPWYGVLGNHEYGYNVDAQIEMAVSSPLWVMDDRYYSRRIALGGGSAHLSLIFLDTNPCISAYRSTDPSGWDPCGTDFPTCAPVSEGPCHFHENILAQDCAEQLDWLKKALDSGMSLPPAPPAPQMIHLLQSRVVPRHRLYYYCTRTAPRHVARAPL